MIRLFAVVGLLMMLAGCGGGSDDAACVTYEVANGEACASASGYTSACLPCSANTPECTVELVPLIEPGDGGLVVGPNTPNLCR
jgi:hypothetical protein